MNRERDETSSDQAAPALPDQVLISLYSELLRPRVIEEKMLLLLRQGKISKWFSAIGQEAISVGAAMALRSDEFMLTAHRNLGVFTCRGLPLIPLFSQLIGKGLGFTNGRDRSFHFGAPAYRVIGMISHMGAQLPIADGIGLAHRLSNEKKVVLVFCGDGATSEGDFHEALNLASVWSLPVIFLIENNGWALSTPAAAQYACKKLADRAAGYGMEGCSLDGNDAAAIYHSIREIAASIRERPRPVLVECETYRIRGHEEASGVKYVPQDQIEEWKKRDPLLLIERKLDERGVYPREERDALKAAISSEVDRALEEALNLPQPPADRAKEFGAVFRPRPPAIPPGESKSELRFIDAISDALREGMRAHPNLLLIGQDIAEYGGVFKVTKGFVEEFGPERVRNTPLCESAVVGAALGLSLLGYKSIVEMQFADFVSCCFNQIVTTVAELPSRTSRAAPIGVL